jgi:signal transduction histidine kinase
MRLKGLFVAVAVIAVPWLAVSLNGGERRRAVVRWDRDAVSIPSTLVGILAHEMRSPLATLRGAVDLLRRDTLPPDRRAEILEITDEAATRLARIVDDAVAAVRAGRGDLPIVGTLVDLEQAVRDCVRAASTDRSAPPITVAAQDGLPLVNGDETRIRQVVTNLLQNALAHADAGSTVIVSVVRDGNNARVTFHNDGPGIDGAQQPQLFQPFTGNGRAGSMGLGLYIAKRLVEAMGGAISFDTIPGATATFWFTLPADDAHRARN